jgi:uncharacterized protein (DUF433 family)
MTTAMAIDAILDDEDHEVFDRVTSKPDVLGGKPCIAGSRISVQIVLEWLAGGGNIQQIVTNYPFLTEEDVRQAILFAAQHMSASALVSR